MDTLDLLHASADRLLSLADGLDRPALARPTPCSGWDVRALLSHTIATIDAFSTAVDGQGGPSEEELFSGADRVGDDPARVARESAARSHRAWSSVNDWEAPVTTVLGPMPAAQAVAILAYSNLVHSWDLATALGRPFQFDEAEARLAEEVGGQLVPATRPRGLFGPEVAVPSTATPTDRIVAFSGRHPHPDTP
jgi:uncharacterized protein (TIGR03086 family)